MFGDLCEIFHNKKETYVNEVIKMYLVVKFM